ncbi:hypothetical protein EDB81DRAFT_810069 [Dactylonectria macrodidyma]|uniref:Uncharacterized protein n=1 Tax=Dactylonectria macrodidyma TaxID=307937 RepID=A0A9P9INT1_9HYPO|nr:hypothetical protein EDB81DRAFT_810069 [Dactylonectria macrodidyma]
MDFDIPNMFPDMSPDALQRSPRHLVLEKAEREILRGTKAAETSTSDKPGFKTREPDHIKISSHFKPQLQGGDYTIMTTQDMETEGEAQNLATQITPQFQLPQNAILSVHPAKGQEAPVETLPHVAFKDPYLPWAREVVKGQDSDRNKVPWLALLLFTADEVSLTPQELNGTDSLFQGCKRLDMGKLKPGATQSIQLYESDIQNVAKVISACKKNGGTDVEEAAYNTVFVKTSLFKELVRTYKDGKPVADEDMAKPDVSRYQFLSHMRNTNTDGTSETGEGMSIGVSSVTFSHRTGPVGKMEPTPVVAHLVSLEGIPDMQWPIPDISKYVILPTLHSWVYTSLPSNSVTMADKMKRIRDQIDLLRSPKSLPEPRSGSELAGAYERTFARSKDGYTITRYRTQTGEETVARFRGVLVPTTNNITPDRTTQLSNSGTDLQVLDQATGLMDLSYSSAWQLGRTLALKNAAFCAALGRLRTMIQRLCVNKGRNDKVPALDFREIGQSVSQAIENMRKLSKLESSEAMQDLAAPANDDKIYEELDKPNSTDWNTVLGWVLDRKFLAGIPAHYLIPDPSFLPTESLRFLHIDQTWLDVMIDGALSIGNHLETKGDSIRAAIKRAINRYCTTPIPHLNRPPQVPSVGFLLRSDLVTQFPDMGVDAVFDPPLDPTCAPILRRENISEGVMLCLFDSLPGRGRLGGLQSLRFTQSPHQQSFSIGSKLNEVELHPTYRRIYREYNRPSDEANDQDEAPSTIWYNPSDPNHPPSPDDKPIFAWGKENEIRTLIFPSYPDHVLSRLQNKISPEDTKSTLPDDGTTAAMVGIALNNSGYELVISLSQDKPIKP